MKDTYELSHRIVNAMNAYRKELEDNSKSCLPKNYIAILNQLIGASDMNTIVCDIMKTFIEEE